jgi:hypothetical protein
MVVAEPIARTPAVAGVAAMVGSCHDVEVEPRPRVLPDKVSVGGWAEEAVVVVVEVSSNGLVVEPHRASERREVVDRSLVEADVLREERLIHWEKRVPQPGGHRQAEAYPPKDGQERSQEEVVVVVAYRRKVAVDKVAVGWASQGAEARYQRGVGVQYPVANLLFDLRNRK